MAPWWGGEKPAQGRFSYLTSLANHFGFGLDVPWKELPAKVRKLILEGSAPTDRIRFRDSNGHHRFSGPFEVLAYLDRHYQEAEPEKREKSGSESSCPSAPAKPAPAPG